MFQRICKNTPTFPDRTKYKVNYSNELMDLITKLLNKNPLKRLGAKNDSDEILQHPFFADVDIEALQNKQIDAPFKPEVINFILFQQSAKFVKLYQKF